MTSMLASHIPTIGKGKVQGETIKVVCAYPDIYIYIVYISDYIVGSSYLSRLLFVGITARIISPMVQKEIGSSPESPFWNPVYSSWTLRNKRFSHSFGSKHVNYWEDMGPTCHQLTYIDQSTNVYIIWSHEISFRSLHSSRHWHGGSGASQRAIDGLLLGMQSPNVKGWLGCTITSKT